MSKKRKNPRVKPWENNEPFIEFVKLYQKQKKKRYSVVMLKEY